MNKHVAIALSLSSLLPCSNGCFAQLSAVVWDDAIDCNAPGTGSFRPRIDLNGDGMPVVLWGRMSPNSNHVAIGNGSGFSVPVEVSTPGCVPSVADWMGSSIAAAGNTVWVVMKATPEESKPVYVRRSDDGGDTWGDTLRVDPYDGLVSRFPSIAVVDPERPLVQYMQFDGGWSGARQVVTHFMAGSFMEPVQVSTPYAPGEVCDCCPGQVVADELRAVALYRNAGSNIRVMWGASSFDEGASFPSGALLDGTGWMLAACPSSGPDGYLVGDSIRYVWMSGAENGLKTYLCSALASDLSTAAPQYVHPLQPANQQQNYPRIAGSGDTLGVVWEQNYLGETDIYFAWSTTGVTGLSTPMMVNSGAGTQRTPDIAFANGAFHIVWREAGTNQVRYRRGVLQDITGISSCDPESFSIRPNPVRHLLHVSVPNARNAEVMTGDGRVAIRSAVVSGALDVGTLASGVYVLRVQGSNGRWQRSRFMKE